MRNSVRLGLLPLICFVAYGGFVQGASAAVQSVNYGNLVASATVATPLDAGDTLFLNTFTTETGGVGSLHEETTFTVGPGVASFIGRAAWEVGGANEPNLGGVNIRILDASSTEVANDTFAGVLAGFAHSTFGPGATPLSIGPGTYTLIATGNGTRASSLDISLTFAQTVVPEAGTFSMLIAGMAVLGLLVRRRLM